MADCLPIPSGSFQRRDESSLLGTLVRALPARRRKSKALATLETAEIQADAHRSAVTRRPAAPSGPMTLMQAVILKYVENLPADYDAEEVFPRLRHVDRAV